MFVSYIVFESTKSDSEKSFLLQLTKDVHGNPEGKPTKNTVSFDLRLQPVPGKNR